MEFYCGGTRQVQFNGINYFTILFAGCNFRCPYCYNLKILEFKKEFLTDIKNIKGLIEMQDNKNIMFAGAEPCLQRQAIINLSRFCKRRGLKISVHTNGSNPNAIRSLIEENLVDGIILDLKSPFNDTFERITKSKTFFRSSEEIKNKIKITINLISKSNIDCSIVTTLVPNFIFRKTDVLKIADIVDTLDNQWILNRFIPCKELDKKFLNINPLSESYYIRLKEICLREYPNLDIFIN